MLLRTEFLGTVYPFLIWFLFPGYKRIRVPGLWNRVIKIGNPELCYPVSKSSVPMKFGNGYPVPIRALTFIHPKFCPQPICSSTRRRRAWFHAEKT